MGVNLPIELNKELELKNSHQLTKQPCKPIDYLHSREYLRHFLIKDSFKTNGEKIKMWELVTLLEEKRSVGCKWMYPNKV